MRHNAQADVDAMLENYRHDNPGYRNYLTMVDVNMKGEAITERCCMRPHLRAITGSPVSWPLI